MVVEGWDRPANGTCKYDEFNQPTSPVWKKYPSHMAEQRRRWRSSPCAAGSQPERSARPCASLTWPTSPVITASPTRTLARYPRQHRAREEAAVSREDPRRWFPSTRPCSSPQPTRTAAANTRSPRSANVSSAAGPRPRPRNRRRAGRVDRLLTAPGGTQAPTTRPRKPGATGTPMFDREDRQSRSCNEQAEPRSGRSRFRPRWPSKCTYCSGQPEYIHAGRFNRKEALCT